MASDVAAETRKMALTTTNKEENFVTGCKGLCVTADGDCVIDFDRPCDSGSFLIKANTPICIPAPFTRLNAMTLASTANLYIVALR